MWVDVSVLVGVCVVSVFWAVCVCLCVCVCVFVFVCALLRVKSVLLCCFKSSISCSFMCSFKTACSFLSSCFSSFGSLVTLETFLGFTE